MKKTQLISEEVKKLQKMAGIIKEGNYRGPSRYEEPTPFSQSGMGPDPGEPEEDNEGPGAQKSVVMKTGTFDREFMDYLRDNNITFKILQWNGRGTSGTNPEVEYYGDRAALEAMIDGPFDSGDAEQNQDYKDQIEQA